MLSLPTRHLLSFRVGSSPAHKLRRLGGLVRGISTAATTARGDICALLQKIGVNGGSLGKVDFEDKSTIAHFRARHAGRRSMATLSTFLAQARERLKLASTSAAYYSSSSTPSSLSQGQDDGTVTFVVGNESADLDSLCSSLVLAYFKSQEALSSTAHSPSQQGKTPPSTLHIPLCHLPRADLTLRPEFTAVLEQAGLTPDELITLDDIPFPSSTAEGQQEGGHHDGSASRPSLDPSRTRWFLVDHNVLTGRLAREFLPTSGSSSSSSSSSAGGGKIVACIDHHDDEGKLPPTCDPRIIQKSGSCMSLIIEHYRPVWDALSSSCAPGTTPTVQEQQQQAKLDDQLARLVMAPILIDTNDLRDANKTTEHDTQVVAWLEETKITHNHHHQRRREEEGHDIVGSRTIAGKVEDEEAERGRGARFDRTAYFNHVQDLKNDISQMSLRDVLRKDYKEWTETATSTSTSPSSGSTETIRLGTMSCSCRIGYLLTHTCQNDAELFVRGMRDWIDEKELDVAAIMSAYEDEETGGGFKRDLFLWGVNARGGGGAGGDRGGDGQGRGVEVVDKFVTDYDGVLKLMPWEDGRLDSVSGSEGKEGFRRCWMQGTTKFSRKQVAPMLREAMRGVLG